VSYDDPSRRSARLTATIRPPDGLADGNLNDRVVDALRAADIGVDVSSVEELGDADPGPP
jgi:hypothetical protein